MCQLHSLSIAEAANEIRHRRLSPLDLVRAHLDRIDKLDRQLQSYVTVTAELALQQAKAATEAIGQGNYRGRLHGIPVSFKDTIATAGVRTTAASRLYENWVPDTDATVVARLRRAGAVLLGKAMLSENGFIGTQTARNPWNVKYSPGASSSGSAAAVAAGLAMASIGSDSGGSIRNPAAVCGVTGFKPTFGLVSRHGILPLSYSFDTVGPLVRSAEDAALVLQAIAGHDQADRVSRNRTVPEYARALGRSLKGVKVGVPRRFIEAAGTRSGIADAFHKALEVLRQQGASLRDVEVPYLGYSRAVNWTILRVEGFNVHLKNLRERRDRYSPPAFRALAVGGFLGGNDYLRAQQARTLLAREMAREFEQVDVLAMPTRPTTAAGGSYEQRPRTPKDAVPRSGECYVAPFNVSGGPALSIPCGFDEHGLPIGLQLAAAPGEDAVVLAAAHQYQLATAWHRRRPVFRESGKGEI